MVVTTLVAVLAILGLAVGDLIIEGDEAHYSDDVLPPPEPEYEYLDETVADVRGYTDEGATSGMDLGRLPVNTTALRAELTWQDDMGDNDEVELVLLLNGTEAARRSDTSGSIQLEITEGDLNGTYGVRVTAVDCPGLYPVPIDRDTGNSWDLTITATVRYQR